MTNGKKAARKGKAAPALAAPRNEAQAAPEKAPRLEQLAARAEAKKAAAKPATKAKPAPKAKAAQAQAKPAPKAQKAQAKPAKPAPKAKAEAPSKDALIEGALRILRASTKEGSVQQIRKPAAAGKVKPLPGRKSPTTRDYVAAIAGVGAEMAFRAIQIVKADPKLAERVIAGKLSLAEAFAAARG